VRIFLILTQRAVLLPAIAGAAFAFSLAAPAVAASHAVSIIDFGYTPASITVQAGDTVVWTNTGQAVHTVSADNGSFDSGTLLSGRTFAMTFSTAGTFAYHCNVHPSMHGTVVVQSAAASAAPAAPAASAPTVAPACPQPAAPAAGTSQTAPVRQAPAAATSQSVATGTTVVRAMPATGSGGAPASGAPVLPFALGALTLCVLGGTLYRLARRG